MLMDGVDGLMYSAVGNVGQQGGTESDAARQERRYCQSTQEQYNSRCLPGCSTDSCPCTYYSLMLHLLSAADCLWLTYTTS